MAGGNKMTEDGESVAQHAALNCYLSSLLAIANALALTCPEVGGIYRHRLTRLRARLAFDSSPKSLEESRGAVESEIKEYATEAANYVAHRAGELRATIGALEGVIRNVVQRQDFYSARLRQFARQMEAAHYPAQREALQEVVAMQAAGLLSCVESMSHEVQSLASRVSDELAAMERRIEEAVMTDPLTGMMNRREMERRIAVFQASGEHPVLLHFHLTGAVTAEVVQQVAARLGSQFRHKDFIARWTDTDFMVLFQGPLEIARRRSEGIVPWIAGPYVVEGAQTVEIGVEVEVLAEELAKSAV